MDYALLVHVLKVLHCLVRNRQRLSGCGSNSVLLFFPKVFFLKMMYRISIRKTKIIPGG